jgi:tRNA(Ile)-lysidine synthase
LEKIIESLKVLVPDTTILVGVSGGADSVVLGYLLHRSGFHIEIAHCHFNLRGESADADQEFTRKFAEELDVPFHTMKFETEEYARSRHISIQMAARELRYDWFEKIREERSLKKIAVGTHLTDNIETFIFNATRGSGLRGLRGIKLENGNVIRPLLLATKEEIYDYAKSMDLDWVEDVSNQSIKYHRNKIRHKVLPILKEINPNLEYTFKRNFERLSRLDEFVQNEIDLIWNKWVTDGVDEIKLPISELLTHDFTDVILIRKLSDFGFNKSQVEDLIRTLNRKDYIGSVIKCKEYQINVDRSEIFISPIGLPINEETYEIIKPNSIIAFPIHLKLYELKTENLVFSTSKNVAFFDIDKLIFPLKLRKWKVGDKIKPFGMSGTKKISDLLIDHKIPLHLKDETWVLESNEEIIWVIGLRSSQTHKVDLDSSRVCKVEFLNT